MSKVVDCIVKNRTALQGQTIKQYIIDQPSPGNAGSDQAWAELKAILLSRISAGLQGKTSTMSMQAIIGEELADGSHV